MDCRIALCQLSPRLGDVDANLELLARWFRRAGRDGAALTVFPELALTGYVLQDLVPEVALRADDARLAALSREVPGATMVVGFVEETDAYRFANSVAVLRDGELIGLHRKLYLPTYGLFDEARFTRPGDRIRTVDVGSPLGRIGLSVCEDFWHPLVPMLQAQDGAVLLVNIAAGPARAPGSAAGTAAVAAWGALLETHAMLDTVAVAFCNRVGNEEGLTFWGGSRLVGPDGVVLAQARNYEEALLIANVELDDIVAARRRRPVLAEERLALTRRELDRIIAARAGLPAATGTTRSRSVLQHPDGSIAVGGPESPSEGASVGTRACSPALQLPDLRPAGRCDSVAPVLGS